MGILINPSGRTVEVDNEELCERLIQKEGFKLATKDEITSFRQETQKNFVKETPSNNSLFFYAPCNKPNGFGMAQVALRDALLQEDVLLDNRFKDQKVGLVFSSPDSLDVLNTDIKIIYTMFESTKIPKRWARLLEKIDLVLVPSEFCQKAFKSRGIDSVVVPLGYNVKNFFFKEKRNNEYFTFLHYDAFNTRKGWDLVFKAFDQEFKKKEKVRLVLKTIRDNIPVIMPRSQYPNIEIIREVYQPSELRKLNWRADCFVFPSRGEGFGLTPLESLACGTPAIIPNGSGMSEYFDKDHFLEVDIKETRPALYDIHRDEDVGDFIEPSLRSLRKQMRYAFEHKKEMHKMGQEGANWVKQNYTINHCARGVAREVNKLCKQKGIQNLIDKKRVEEKVVDNEDAIIFLTEDTQHITGGRYYSWWLATALKEAGYEVIIYTNRIPIFIDEFKEYEQPEVRIVGNLRAVDVIGKAYIGSPIVGSEAAAKLGEKYKKPSFCEIFDPFPMMEKYRGKHHWPGWDNLLPLLRESNCNIISLCKTTNRYIYDWLNKRKDQVFEIYPCINSREKNKARKRKKKNWVTFISRLDHHKKLDHVLDAVKETDCELHVITSIDGVNFPKMVKDREMEDRVVIHKFATDEEKFEIIKQSRATINGAIFEGFGMWLTESLSCGVPAVCYEYPTFKEIKSVVKKKDQKLVHFAKYKDAEDLKAKLKDALKIKTKTRGTKQFDFDKMVKRVKEVVDVRPRIGVVTIALNEQEYIGASLKSMLKQEAVSKIAVVEGAVNLYGAENPKLVTENGLSVDKTKQEVMKVMRKDKEGKIIYQQYGWAKDKSELRNRCLELLGKDCDYIMVVDADEVWKTKDFKKLVDYTIKHPETSVVWYPAYHFWKKPDMIAVGSQWDVYLFRFFKYEDKTLKWDNHCAPTVNKEGKPATKIGGQEILKDVHFYHYGAMKSEANILGKLKFYQARDKELKVKDTWTRWKKGKETQWTHGKGTTKKFRGTHPREVINIIRKHK